MSLRVLLVAAPLASLLFSTVVEAVGVNVTANCTLRSYDWTFNSLGQSPCVVAAYMLATCYEGSYTLSPLPSGYAYRGPYHDYSNKCQCSTVGYSLISACVVCQNREPFYWSSYVDNCTSVLPPSQFPNPVPAGIRVPRWATLDVTNENSWNANESYAAGDNPEYGPGAIFGASGVYTSSASASSTASSTPSHHGSHAGPIAGGVIAGIAIIAIAVAAIFYLRRRFFLAPSARSADFGAFQPRMDEVPRPLSDGGTIGLSSPSIRTKFSQFSEVPNEQTTFQGYAGLHSVDTPHPGSISSHIGSASNLANMQTSPPQTRGYHGLPMPHT